MTLLSQGGRYGFLDLVKQVGVVEFCNLLQILKILDDFYPRLHLLEVVEADKDRIRDLLTAS
jgi:hypothetical protein